MEVDLHVRFYTKQSKYSIADNLYALPSTYSVTELNKFINRLLVAGDSLPDVDFDFLVHGEILSTSLQQHLLDKNLSLEVDLEVEYVTRQPAPEPENSLQHNDWVSCVQASEKYILSGCYDNTVHLWSHGGEQLTTIPAHSAPIKCLSWIQRNDGSHTFVTGSYDESLLLWKWSPKKRSVDCLLHCRGHSRSVDCLAINPTFDKVCSGSWDNTLMIWSLDTATAKTDDEEAPKKKKRTEAASVPTQSTMFTLAEHNGGVSAVVWAEETDIISASWDHTLRIWDLKQGISKQTINGTKVFLDISLSRMNGLLATASADRHVRLWDPRIKDGQTVRTILTSHNGWVTGVEWSTTDSNQLLSGSYDMLLKLWDIRSPKAPLYDMSGHTDKILAVDWTRPQLMLSGGADNQLKIFHKEH